jgi:hypothetical protein
MEVRGRGMRDELVVCVRGCKAVIAREGEGGEGGGGGGGCSEK